MDEYFMLVKRAQSTENLLLRNRREKQKKKLYLCVTPILYFYLRLTLFSGNLMSSSRWKVKRIYWHKIFCFIKCTQQNEVHTRFQTNSSIFYWNSDFHLEMWMMKIRKDKICSLKFWIANFILSFTLCSREVIIQFRKILKSFHDHRHGSPFIFFMWAQSSKCESNVYKNSIFNNNKEKRVFRIHTQN